MECKGMVQCLTKTYRIMKVDRGTYEVIRIEDDTRVGSFDTNPRLRVRAAVIPHELLAQIAMTALKQAKLSWPPRKNPASTMVPPVRRPSSGLVGS